MNSSGTFSGQFIVNGEVDADSVSVFIADGQANFKSEPPGRLIRGKSLSLTPFNRFVLFSQDPREIVEGSCLSLAGTNIGSCIDGPLGNPADNEIVIRKIVSAQIATFYSLDGLRTSIEGVTKEATLPHGFRLTNEPWAFKLWFDIPISAFKSFFGLNSASVARIYSKARSAAS